MGGNWYYPICCYGFAYGIPWDDPKYAEDDRGAAAPFFEHLQKLIKEKGANSILKPHFMLPHFYDKWYDEDFGGREDYGGYIVVGCEINANHSKEVIDEELNKLLDLDIKPMNVIAHHFAGIHHYLEVY
jgi:hypothetical protein